MTHRHCQYRLMKEILCLIVQFFFSSLFLLHRSHLVTTSFTQAVCSDGWTSKWNVQLVDARCHLHRVTEGTCGLSLAHGKLRSLSLFRVQEYVSTLMLALGMGYIVLHKCRFPIP